MYNLDQTWLPFANLMRRHIFNVLLICSDYDRFMLEQDGRVEEELYREYMQLGLSTPPKIQHTSEPEEAIDMISRLSFDLVITMLDFQAGKVEKLAQRIKGIRPDIPVIVLAPSPDHRKVKDRITANPNIDQIFYWQGNSHLFLAMIKLAEDAMNVEHDTNEADVQVIILIENSVRFISSYLPAMYTCLIQQTSSSILEALNGWGRTLRMRGRPKILLARDGETAMNLYLKYKKVILGIISDVNFSFEGKNEGAGLLLAERIRTYSEDVPILIQSTDRKYEEDARRLGADFIWKNSPSLLSDLEDHFITHYNFGPFNFKDPKTGDTIATAKTMKELQNTIKVMPLESVVYHAKKNDFSRWLRSQSLYTLASLIKSIRLEDSTPEEFRDNLYKTIKDYRIQRTRGVIAQFSTTNYDDTSFFSRIGTGSLGGKGRGLAFIAAEMNASGIQLKYPKIYLSIPRTVVVSTSLFDEFINKHEFDIGELSAMNDMEVLSLFLSSDLPEELVQSLKEFLKVVTQPLSIRSSSLLEDSHSEPFAGVYQTSMISNQGSDEHRLKELMDAIRTVWASVYFERAKEYLKVTGHMVEDEKMAVILQQVTGSRHGNYWFPNVSGVARSLNYYPVEGTSQDDGIGMLSFGLGKAVVDDGSALKFCPAWPKKPVSNLMGSGGSSQESFYALDLTREFNPYDDIDNLVLLPLSEAEKYPKSLRNIVTTMNIMTGEISESSFADGVKTITFNGMLKYDMFPLAPIIDEVLKIGVKSMGTPVEIEIAVNTERIKDNKPDFSILQIRPIASTYNESDVDIKEEDIETSLIYSQTVMGNGIINDIQDIIFIKPECFKASEMIDMAEELSLLNANMGDREYALIAAGRLGSTDRWLGIPCSWSDISRARIIVETGLPELQVEPSQGTHFFQNVTSLGCVYLTVNPVYNNGKVDYDKLKALPLVEETKHFLHVRNESALDIRVNGLDKKAIIGIKKEKTTWDAIL
ncbi:MAG: DUF5752 family protein [Sphaerochaetaceae bacterium]|nr:DUF5752 family protein [Sphaerochaetaceae bacterium]